MKKFRELSEVQSKVVVMAFGRMNPPTIGHAKLCDKVKSIAGSNPYRIYLSQTVGPKDPLPFVKKLTYAKRSFPKHAKAIQVDKSVKTVIQAAQKVNQDGYTGLVLVAGSDRIQEFQRLLDRYNGKADKSGTIVFDFPDGVRVVSSGERDPDSTDPTEAISASVMRAAAQSGDFETFKNGSPMKEADAKKMYDDVRKFMGVREVKEDLDITSDYDLIRDAYLRGGWGNIGDIVEANGVSGEVVRRGTNYLSFVDEDGKFYKAFLHQIDERAWFSNLAGKLQQKTAPRSFEKMAKQYANLAKKPEFKGKPNLAAAQIALQYRDVNPRTLISYINDLVMQGKLPKELRASYMPTFKEATSVKQSKDIKDREGTQPKKYYAKDAEGDEMSKSTKQARARHFEKGAKKDDNDPSAYKPAPGDATAKTKPSQYTQKMKKKFPDLYDEELIPEAKSPLQKLKDFDKSRVAAGKPPIFTDKTQSKFIRMKKKGQMTIMNVPTSDIDKFIKKGYEIIEARNYKLEYERFHSRPEEIERRSSRNKARRIMGDKAEKGMDVGHKDNNPLNNDPDNLRNENPSDNRREPRLRESAADASLRKKAEKTGISFSILKQVYKRGVAAWRTGHRPGTTPEQWGHARVNSFATGGKTRTTADADLWKQHKGKSESVDLGESWKPSTISGYSALMFAKEFPEHEVKGAFQYHPDVLKALDEIDEGLFREDYNNWVHEEPVKYAKHLEQTFGPPDEMTDSELCWVAKDGFKRIVVKDEYILHGSPAPHYDFVYCYIDLQVPEEYAEPLAKSSGSILIDYLKGEVGARCGSLTANATTLNYVLDVVAKRVTPSKEEYEKRILSMTRKFDNGEKFEVDWWPDESGDADPKNEYYAEGMFGEGLWDNIRKKRERIKSGSGERMRKKGEKGAPTPDQIQKAQEEACCEDCETESVLIENNQYRVGSEAYFEYFNDMRKMYNEGRLEVTGFDKELMEGDLGNFATYEEQVVPLDCPMMEEEEKNPPLNKPKAGGPKKYYVYVRDPSTGNVKKVTWGDTTGLKVKLNDPAARKSFAARHKCDQQKDKTKASYWACNLPRYASQLGLSGGGNFYW